MQSAAGGTSQRLKPAVAIVRSLSSNPVPAPGMVPALLIDVIVIFPLSPASYRAFCLRSHRLHPRDGTAPSCCSAQFPNPRGSPRAFEHTHPHVLIMLAALAAN